MMFGSVEFFIPGNKHFFFHFLATAFGGAAITYVLLTGARARRLAVLEHIRKVAELNHNVRNALDVILSAQHLSAALAEQDRKLREYALYARDACFSRGWRFSDHAWCNWFNMLTY
jgi:hypothetical protein